MKYLLKQFLIAFLIFLVVILLLNHFKINQEKDLASWTATFCITVSGFFMTSLSILAGFSSLPYMQRLLKAQNIYNALISYFIMVIALNFFLFFLNLIFFLLSVSKSWLFKTNFSLLTADLYLVFVALWLFYKVLKNLALVRS